MVILVIQMLETPIYYICDDEKYDRKENRMEKKLKKLYVETK